MPPQYVKAYVTRGKNDAADAAAVCEAVTRPSMRFVPVKTEEQQSALTMHRVRELVVRQRTQLINAVRGHLAESVSSAPGGPGTCRCSRRACRRIGACRSWRVKSSSSSPLSSTRSGSGSPRSTAESSLGTRPILSAGGSLPSLPEAATDFDPAEGLIDPLAQGRIHDQPVAVLHQ